MTIRSQQQRRVESGHTPTVRWEPPKRVKAALGNIQRVVLVTVPKMPFQIFQQIVDEYRAGKKDRI